MTTAIDLFAGAGGFTSGATAAGVEVLWAANHWPTAVLCHKSNHPSVAHACQDLQQADFSEAPPHDVLLASPSCVGHTRARGKEKPSHDSARATAWAVVTCAEVHRPPLVVVENVPEFAQWALYPAWCMAMKALGYSVSPHVVDAADHGVPQHRVRLFLVCTRSRAPLVLDLPKQPHVPARSFVDFDAGRWSKIDRPGRAAKTLARVRSGRKHFGDRFLVAYYGSTRGGRSLDRPIGSLTTRDRYGVIDGDRMRMLSVSEARAAMGFDSSYALPRQKRLAMHLLGNAVPPPLAARVIEALIKQA